MINNDILRRLRYALDIQNSVVIELAALVNYKLDTDTLINILKKEEQEGFEQCSDEILANILDGLIIQRRGKKKDDTGEKKPLEIPLTNNIILKKLRIALELKEKDLLEILELADLKISKSELSALFRRKEQKHYKKCGDQFLRNFLFGLTKKYRE